MVDPTGLGVVAVARSGLPSVALRVHRQEICAARPCRSTSPMSRAGHRRPNGSGCYRSSRCAAVPSLARKASRHACCPCRSTSPMSRAGGRRPNGSGCSHSPRCAAVPSPVRKASRRVCCPCRSTGPMSPAGDREPTGSGCSHSPRCAAVPSPVRKASRRVCCPCRSTGPMSPAAHRRPNGSGCSHSPRFAVRCCSFSCTQGVAPRVLPVSIHRPHVSGWGSGTQRVWVSPSSEVRCCSFSCTPRRRASCIARVGPRSPNRRLIDRFMVDPTGLGVVAVARSGLLPLPYEFIVRRYAPLARVGPRAPCLGLGIVDPTGLGVTAVRGALLFLLLHARRRATRVARVGPRAPCLGLGVVDPTGLGAVVGGVSGDALLDPDATLPATLIANECPISPADGADVDPLLLGEALVGQAIATLLALTPAVPAPVAAGGSPIAPLAGHRDTGHPYLDIVGIDQSVRRDGEPEGDRRILIRRYETRRGPTGVQEVHGWAGHLAPTVGGYGAACDGTGPIRRGERSDCR